MAKPVAGVRPAGLVAGAGGAASASTSAGPSAELKQIALFIQRWKLEATKAKLILARLTPTKRRWVMSNYKGAQPLSDYIQHCDRTNAWAAATVPGATGAAPAAYGAPKPGGALATGIKRPLGALGGSLGAGPSKLPRLAGSVAAAGPYGGASYGSASPPARFGPKQPAGAPPGGILRMGAKAAPGAGTRPGGAPPSWATQPGSYGGKPAAPKPSGVRPALRVAVKPSGVTAPTYGGLRSGYGQPGKAPAAKPMSARPGGYGGYPAAAKPAGPPKAKSKAGAPGSLIKSLLKSL